MENHQNPITEMEFPLNPEIYFLNENRIIYTIFITYQDFRILSKNNVQEIFRLVDTLFRGLQSFGRKFAFINCVYFSPLLGNCISWIPIDPYQLLTYVRYPQTNLTFKILTLQTIRTINICTHRKHNLITCNVAYDTTRLGKMHL